MTAACLSLGSIAAAACFLVALVLAGLGRPAASGPALEPAAALGGMAGLDARAWASAGVVILLATPVLGLLATTVEYVQADAGRERRYAVSAAAVLAVLAVSLVLALVR